MKSIFRKKNVFIILKSIFNKIGGRKICCWKPAVFTSHFQNESQVARDEFRPQHYTEVISQKFIPAPKFKPISTEICSIGKKMNSKTSISEKAQQL